MRQLVETIVKALVDDPNAVRVNELAGEQSTIIEVRAADADIGKVIGKHGQTAQSIRTLLKAVGTKEGRRYMLEIVDSNQPRQARPGQPRGSRTLRD